MITVGVVLAVAWAVVLCLSRVRRLHRLHIRVDAARAGLDAALARRVAAAARAGVALPEAPAQVKGRLPEGPAALVEGALPEGPAALVKGRLPDAPAARAGVVQAAYPPAVAAWPGAAPGGVAAQAPRSGAPAAACAAQTGGQATVASVRPDAGAGPALPVPGVTSDPEGVANALSRALARLDRAALPDDVRAALADAEQLLVLARRVHNDAVRDTLGLRSRRLVRWLRLAGTAPMPAYFEIADPPAALTYDRMSPSQE